MNNDLISRAQAIDDIWTVSPLARLDRKWVDRWLRQLPSAQPTFDARDTQYNLPIGTDCICRQAAIDALENTKTAISENGERYIAKQNAIMRIDALPSVQPKLLQPWEVLAAQSVLPQPKKGKWIYHIDDLFPVESTMECNQCHAEQPLTCDDEFCPHCGAKMEVTI